LGILVEILRYRRRRRQSLLAALVVDIAYWSMGYKAVAKTRVRCYTHIGCQLRDDDANVGPMSGNLRIPCGEENEDTSDDKRICA